MKLSDSERVHAFLADLQTMSPDQFEIVQFIRDIFNRADGELTEAIKYGGLIFKQNTVLVGGIFPYKKHISIEFSNGAEIPDSFGFLEGTGKKRRHIKIVLKEDVERKKAGFYINEAVKN